MHEDCIPRIQNLDSRKAKYENPTLRESAIPPDCKIYRAVSRVDKRDATQPDFTCFTDKGLSVLIEGSNLPPLDLASVFKQWKERGYLGIWEMPMTLFPQPAYLLRHDPFPFESGGKVHQQDANHAQIFCHKPQSKGKEVARSGKWAIAPG